MGDERNKAVGSSDLRRQMAAFQAGEWTEAATRLRELALAIANANGVLRVQVYRGKSYAKEEIDYQNAVKVFDAALRGFVCMAGGSNLGKTKDAVALHHESAQTMAQPGSASGVSAQPGLLEELA